MRYYFRFSRRHIVAYSATAITPSVIRVLRRHGMNDQALQAVYRSVVLAKLLYASSAWWGFTTSDDRHRVEAVRRGVRAGLYPADGPAAAQLVEDYDEALFSRLLSFQQHVLHGLLPAQTDHDQGRRHGFESGGDKFCERSEQKIFFLTPPLFGQWGDKILLT